MSVQLSHAAESQNPISPHVHIADPLVKAAHIESQGPRISEFEAKTGNGHATAASHFEDPSHLVLSLFPGAGLLDRGFSQAGFCVVRGPDTLLGQRIEDFSALALRGHVVGIIGGPPCQDFSRARRRPPTGHGLKMLAEFARVVTEASPEWFLMENVPQVPDIHISGYQIQRFNCFAWEFGCRQRRNRSFQFGSRNGAAKLVLRRSQSQLKKRLSDAALASKDGGRTFADFCELQGLPRWFDLPGLSRSAKYRAIGNGVPVPMALGIAKAIRDRQVTEGLRLCPCDCGRVLTGRQQYATAACRKRMERLRKGWKPGRVTPGRVTRPDTIAGHDTASMSHTKPDAFVRLST
jgi:DNA (cytosine-5)-methyltransferase 1